MDFHEAFNPPPTLMYPIDGSAALQYVDLDNMPELIYGPAPLAASYADDVLLIAPH